MIKYLSQIQWLQLQELLLSLSWHKELMINGKTCEWSCLGLGFLSTGTTEKKDMSLVT